MCLKKSLSSKCILSPVLWKILFLALFKGNKMKKKIIFTAPIHLKQGVKVKDGEMKSYFEWDIFERFFRFIVGLFPRIKEREVGATYATLREGYFGVGINGQLESLVLPSIDEETEELVKNIALSISLNENISEQNSLISLEMKR